MCELCLDLWDGTLLRYRLQKNIIYSETKTLVYTQFYIVS